MVEGLRDLLKNDSHFKLLNDYTHNIVELALKMNKYEENRINYVNNGDIGSGLDMKMKSVLLLQRFSVLDHVYRRFMASDEQIDKEFNIIKEEVKQLEELPEYNSIIKGLELLKDGISQRIKIDLEVHKTIPKKVSNRIYR